MIENQDEKKLHMIETWTKFAILFFDLKEDRELLEIINGMNDELKIEKLGEYGISPQDCRKFTSDITGINLRGWWIG
jgi:hypothetical protein